MIDRFFIQSQYNTAYHVQTADGLQRLFDARAEEWPVVFDTETTGLENGVPNVLYDPTAEREVSRQLYPVVFGISLAIVVQADRIESFRKVCKMTPGWCGLALAWCRLGTDMFDMAVRVLTSQCDKAAHNLKYDLWVCEANDIVVNGRHDDTLCMSRLFWNRRRSHGLKKLTEFLAPALSQYDDVLKKELTRLKGHWTRVIKAGDVDWPYQKVPYANYSHIPEEMMCRYASLDAFVTLFLWMRLQSECIWR